MLLLLKDRSRVYVVLCNRFCFLWKNCHILVQTRKLIFDGSPFKDSTADLTEPALKEKSHMAVSYTAMLPTRPLK